MKFLLSTFIGLLFFAGGGLAFASTPSMMSDAQLMTLAVLLGLLGFVGSLLLAETAFLAVPAPRLTNRPRRGMVQSHQPLIRRTQISILWGAVRFETGPATIAV